VVAGAVAVRPDGGGGAGGGGVAGGTHQQLLMLWSLFGCRLSL
jgi:hypothetical protein